MSLSASPVGHRAADSDTPSQGLTIGGERGCTEQCKNTSAAPASADRGARACVAAPSSSVCTCTTPRSWAGSLLGVPWFGFSFTVLVPQPFYSLY